MSDPSTRSDTPGAVFLSYTSQDAAAARRICDALRSAGIEVWFDQNELVGGDAWDAKIRRQIASCALFAPIISGNTQARLEGYFRIEWKLAAQRTHAMAEEKAFLVPIVIDDTRDADAKVPAEFKSVQWTRLLSGETPPKFCTRVRSLLSSEEVLPPNPTTPLREPNSRAATPAPARHIPAAGWAAAALLALTTLGYFALRPAVRQSSASASDRPTAPERSSEPLTEVGRLVGQAQKILLKTEVGLTELDDAALLCERAIALDSSSPVAWATASEVETWRYYFGGDRSPERIEGARAKAARALNLSPKAFESRRAQACYRVGVIRGKAAAEAEPDLRQLLTERPHDPISLLFLGFSLREQDKIDEATATFERLAKLPDQAAMAYNEIGWLHLSPQRRALANAAIDQSIAAQPFSSNVSLKVALAQDWLGDNDAALAALEKLPRSAWLEDRVLGAAIRVFHWRNEPGKLLTLLENVPREWITWSIEGPKAAITGDAHARLGHTAAARNDWTVALASVEKRLAVTPNNWKLNVWKAYLLAALGQPEASTRALALARESAGSASGQLDQWLFGRPYIVLAYNLLPRLVPPENLLAQLEKRVASADTCPPLASLRLNPSLATVRELPGFSALLAKAASHPNTAPAGGLAPTATPTSREKSLAVLALDNVGGDPANEAISDGISEELLNSLGRVPGLRVVGGRSTFAFKGTKASEKDIGRQLGVTHLVSGSIRRSGETVRVIVRLVRAETGDQVWTDAFNPELKDILATQERIADSIAQSLSLKLGASRGAATASVAPRAFELYVQARHAWSLRTAAGYDRAEDLLNQALALEPRLARAHSALVDVWLQRAGDSGAIGRFDQRHAPVLAKCRAKANEALTMDPESAEAHASLGLTYSMAWQPSEARRELNQAIALNPNYASAHQWLARNFLADGRLDEALTGLRLAVQLDPLAPRILDNYSNALILAQRFADALTMADRSLEQHPTSVAARFAKAKALLGLGRPAEAIRLIRTLPEDPTYSRSYQMTILATAGAVAEAESTLLGTDFAKSIFPQSFFLLLLGHRSEALAALDSSAIRSTARDEFLFHAAYDPIRTTPKFTQVLAELGLTEAHARAQAWRAAHPPEKAQEK